MGIRPDTWRNKTVPYGGGKLFFFVVSGNQSLVTSELVPNQYKSLLIIAGNQLPRKLFSHHNNVFRMQVAT